MAIVGGLDLHRKQITFDVVDTATGVCERGRVAPADRESFRGWLTGFEGGSVDLAVEGCTGWRFVVEECQTAGVRAHLAEPADVAGLRGRRQHAKTDPVDAHSVAVVALRTQNLVRVEVDPDLVVLGMLADRRDELGRARTQVVNRLHRLLLEMFPGRAKRDPSAHQACA